MHIKIYCFAILVICFELVKKYSENTQTLTA